MKGQWDHGQNQFLFEAGISLLQISTKETTLLSHLKWDGVTL